MEAINFRTLVQQCAQEPEFVECFNLACGAQLQAPISALLDDSWPFQVSEKDQLTIGCFIVFIHEKVWTRLKIASARTGWRVEQCDSGCG